MKLSIVTTLFYSENHIDEFHQRISDTARSLVDKDYEIIMVNDASPDSSLNKAIELAKIDPHVVVIDLSRHFGHHKAIITGLANASGEKVFLIDSDLEEEPELLARFASEIKKTDCDVVYGVQSSRKGGIFERYSGKLFYVLFNFLTKMTLTKNISTVRLMTKRYVSALLQHEEREVYLPGLWHITGFTQRALYFKKLSTSKTTYTLSRKFALLTNSITSFSNTPLISIFYIGLAIFSVSSLFAAYLILKKIFFDVPVKGWTSVIVSIWLLGGLMVSLLGVIGIYLSKVFSEVKQRPFTIIREIYKQ